MSSRYVLMEDDGFALIAQPGEYWVSWISHTDRHCSGGATLHKSAPWRWVNVFDGECNYCQAAVPDGLVGAWMLHNYDNYTKALRIRSNLKSYVK